MRAADYGTLWRLARRRFRSGEDYRAFQRFQGLFDGGGAITHALQQSGQAMEKLRHKPSLSSVTPQLWRSWVRRWQGGTSSGAALDSQEGQEFGAQQGIPDRNTGRPDPRLADHLKRGIVLQYYFMRIGGGVNGERVFVSLWNAWGSEVFLNETS